MRWIVLTLACSACAATPSSDNWGRPFDKAVPKDMRFFVIDAQACVHFEGEGPTGDPERDRFLARMIRETCTNIDHRKAELLKRYGGSEQVRAVIAEALKE